MKYLIVILIVPFVTPLFAQPYNQEWVAKTGDVMLLGPVTTKRLKQKPFKDWYNKNYQSYLPDKEIIEQLSLNFSSVDSIKIFMGTWCGDSKQGVPEMIKVLNQLQFDKNLVSIIAVNRSFNAYKQSPGGEEKGLNIHRVPTMILYSKGLEGGRIVESPKVSWEADLKEILDGNYEPNYAAVSILNKLFQEKGVETVDIVSLAAELKSMSSSIYELNTYGYQLLTSWNIREALLTFKINAIIYSEVADSHFNLARVHQLLGQNNECLSCLKQVLQLEPEHKKAHELMAKLTSSARSH